MLNEIMEVESYLSDPKTTRLNAKLLGDGLKKGEYKLNGIADVLSMIAAYYIYNVTGASMMDEELEKKVTRILRVWFGFEEDVSLEEMKEIKKDKWFKKYPSADGWLRECLKPYLSENRTWIIYSEKWCKAWKSQMAYQAQQLVYKNVIAQALARGPLKEYVLVTKKCNNFFAEIQSEKGKKVTKGREKTLLKLIAAYKLLQLQQPGQKYVLMQTNRILNWCGYNSYKQDRMCPDLRWKNEQLVLVESYKDFRKFSINSHFLDAMEIRLVEKEEAMNIDPEQYDIYQDQGYGKNQGLEKVIVKEGERRRS